ncbi:hypothetical protein BS78_05G092500 [Paspalum vaginatum]|nr:hypothetical protein BS78_05G092500 [Paspalum vaginatum]
MGSPPDLLPSWVILNKHGARRDGFPGDRTMSTTYRNRDVKEISVSFELVEPPGTSVLVVECPPHEPDPAVSALRHSCRAYVLAAHRDVVLLEISSSRVDYPHDHFVDYLVYQASSGGSSRRPSLSLLPDHCKGETTSCAGGTPSPVRIYLSDDDTGIMSCGSRSQEEDSSFIVADLTVAHDHKIWPRSKPSDITVRMFRSWSGEWEIFRNLHVHGANGGHDLEWWSTDAVVAYRRRFFTWVDYYRGMILLDMSSQSEKKCLPPPPELRYVPLPVDTVPGDPEDPFFGRGHPRVSRSVCATRDGIKFVSVDRQRCSSFGVGPAGRLWWKETFRIMTWSLLEDGGSGGDYTWRKDATMSEDELWAALDTERRRRLIPHLTPEYPAVDMENPDAVCFRLTNSNRYKSDEPTWMVEVDMKKVLMAATAYSESKDGSSYGCFVDKGTIESARISSEGLLSFSSELPRYLDGGHAFKKRKH